jgi:hypothetical protein
MHVLNKPASQSFGFSSLLFSTLEASPQIEKKRRITMKLKFLVILLFYLHDI